MNEETHPDGTRVVLRYDDGSEKEGYIEWDNYTIIVHCDDGTKVCIGG